MLDVEGYDYNGLTFAIPGALLGKPGRKRTKGTANALELRDHGLAGGEIQLQLSETNRVPNDPGFYYQLRAGKPLPSGGGWKRGLLLMVVFR